MYQGKVQMATRRTSQQLLKPVKVSFARIPALSLHIELMNPESHIEGMVR